MPDKISKKIKFALFLKDYKEVRTLEEFEKYFSMSEVIRYFLSGKLLSWLRSHNYPEEKCLAIDQLQIAYRQGLDSTDNTKNDARELVKQLSQIFEIPESATTADEKIENILIIEQILSKESEIKDLVKHLTTNERDEILKDVDRIARNQDELDEIIEKSKRQKKFSSIIYLLRNDSPYSLNFDDVFNTNLRFVGLNKISSKHEAEIEIFYENDDGEEFLLEDSKLKTLCSEPQNKNKFNNLVIKSRRKNFMEEDTEIYIRVPKMEIKSSTSDANKKGMEIAEEKLTQYLDAGFPLIYIDNFEEDKADEIIRRSAVSRTIFEWNGAEGLFQYNEKDEIISNVDRQWSLKSTLKFFIDDFRWLRESDGQTKFELNSSVLVLKVINEQLNDSEVISQLKYLSRMIYNGQIEDCNIIIVSSEWNIPAGLEHYITVLKINLTEEEIRNLIIEFCKNQNTKTPSDILQKKFVEAFKGLSEFTILSILSLAFSRDGELSYTDMDLILETKKQIIQKTNILEMVEVTEDEDDIGGLEILKEWLRNKEKIFKNMSLAVECGVKIPKGILIVGMPGCGKTLTAKVTASMFDMPLLRLDMGRIFGKYVGESEKNMRRATQQAEVIAPCVLWIDELEKAFAGVGGDGGAEVATRLFGTFLTWMQEKTTPVFVVATANNLAQLPPELLRKGRFDEVFYVGTPNARERKKIFDIYIDKVENNEKFSCKPKSEKDLNEMVQNSLGFSSADIEGVVFSAVESSFIEFVSEPKYSAEGKPVFNTEMVNQVLKNSPKSGWQQLKKIFQSYMQHDYKNASEHDMTDFFYWLKLRALYLKSLPRKIFSIFTGIFGSILGFINNWAKGKLSYWDEKVHEWDIEERNIKEKGLPKVKWHFRFCRTIVRGSLNFFRRLNQFLRWIFNKKTVDLERKRVKRKKRNKWIAKERELRNGNASKKDA